MSRQRLISALYFLVPMALALILYWPGLTSWFQMDDFALLSLRSEVHDWPTLVHALFAPIAQGTIRTLSERVYYLSSTSLFGIHAFPFRVWAFLTFFATLPILSLVTTRLTGSRPAGFLAAVLWTVNSAVAVPLSWTAVYYELLCALFFVVNIWLLDRYAETGKSSYYITQWIIFLLGFGVLEINVVYPALALAYAILRARRIVWKIAPMFLASAVYTAARSLVVSMPSTGPYRMYWDPASVASTLWTYWNWALEPRRLEVLDIGTPLLRALWAAAIGLGLLLFLLWKLRAREWIVLFFPAWFLIVLAPLLPLREHIADYYLAIPVIGLAMWGGWALVTAWHAGVAARIMASAILAFYLAAAIPVALATTRYYHDRSQRIRALVLGVSAIAHANPDKQVLLSGIDKELFWTALNHHPFGLFGVREVLVLPEDAANVGPGPQSQDPASLLAQPNAVRYALARGRAIVIDASNDSLRDITSQYFVSANIQPVDSISARVDAGSADTAEQLGPEWYPVENRFRWMPQRVTVKLRGPGSPGAKLYLTGFCPAAAVKPGKIQLDVTVDGVHLAPATLTQPDSRFSLSFDLPAQFLGRSSVEVAVELDHVFVPPTDRRPLGLTFGTFEIR